MILVFDEQIEPGHKGLLMVFNISFTIIVFFFAYVSFFCKRDLLYTRLGKSTLGLIALLYLLRGAEEGIFFKFSFVVLIPYVLVGAIYLALLLLPNPEDEEERETGSLKKGAPPDQDEEEPHQSFI
jgi:hypothetical protein